MTNHPPGFAGSGAGFTLVTADLYSNGKLLKSGIAAQLSADLVLLSNTPPLPQSPRAGDELLIGGKMLRIATTPQCDFGIGPHYDLAVEEVEPSGTKSAALKNLYTRITEIAEAMGGTASPSKSAPALHVEMPGGFRVDFAPLQPLSVGNALTVRATRAVPQGRLTDWSCNLGLDGGWQGAKGPLSDDEIRECLTPKGPTPLY